MKHVNYLAAAALALGCGAAQAGLINPGFEGSGNGSLAGWTKRSTSDPANLNGGTVNVVDQHISNENPSGESSVTYEPKEGNWFLMLGTGVAAENDWQMVTQSVDLAQGQTLSGWAAFDWDDYNPFNDAARVRILEGNTEIAQPFYMSGDSFLPSPPAAPGELVPDYYNGPWTQWSWEATQAGVHTYTVEYAVANTFDINGNSYGYFDAVANAAVPEPSSLALVVIGMASLNSMRRKRTHSII